MSINVNGILSLSRDASLSASIRHNISAEGHKMTGTDKATRGRTTGGGAKGSRQEEKPSQAKLKAMLQDMDRKLDAAEARIDRVLERQAQRGA